MPAFMGAEIVCIPMANHATPPETGVARAAIKVPTELQPVPLSYISRQVRLAMEMIERVARELCKSDGHPENIQYEGKPMWASYSDAARAVIKVMREPTESMVKAWLGSGAESVTARRDWYAMIDAALGPTLTAAGESEACDKPW